MPYIKTSSQEELALGFGDYTCNWGVHFCGLYETEEERDEILFGFLSRGQRDGADVFRRIRDINPAVPVVFASGYAVETETVQRLRTGRELFVTKPYDARELTTALRKLLDT